MQNQYLFSVTQYLANAWYRYVLLWLGTSGLICFAMIAILFCCYMYILTRYEPGVQAKQSDAKYISVTKEKDLLKKYNPDFATRSIDWQEKQCETVKR